MEDSSKAPESKPIARERVHAEHLVTHEQNEVVLSLVGRRSRMSKDPEAMRFLAYLVAHARCDFGTTLARIPRENINRARGLRADVGGTGAWLEAFVRTCPVRLVLVRQVAGELCRRLDVAALAPARGAGKTGPKLDIVSGRPAESFEVIACDDPKPEWVPRRAWDIASYFKTVPEGIYEPHVEGETERRAVDARAEGFPWRDVIGSRPKYSQRQDANTYRIDDPWWSSMPRKLVRILFPEWIEMDLEGCYVACFEVVCRAHGVDTPLLSSLLAAPGAEPDLADGPLAESIANMKSDLWLRVCGALGVGPKLRGAVKDFCLPALFGEGVEARSGRSGPLAEQLGELPGDVLARPFVREIVEATKALQRYARERGYLLGIGGRKIKRKSRNGKARNELALIHMACSDLEMELISTVYTEARKWAQRGVYVTRHQHDGVDATGPAGALDGFYEAACSELAAKAEELGVRTRLGCKGRGASIDVEAVQRALRVESMLALAA